MFWQIKKVETWYQSKTTQKDITKLLADKCRGNVLQEIKSQKRNLAIIFVCTDESTERMSQAYDVANTFLKIWKFLLKHKPSTDEILHSWVKTIDF